MTIPRTVLLLLIAFITIALDVRVMYGCSYSGVDVGWIRMLLGIWIQCSGLRFLYATIKDPSYELISRHYYVIGVANKKWYYLMLYVFAGVGVFAWGLNHAHGMPRGVSFFKCPIPVQVPAGPSKS